MLTINIHTITLIHNRTQSKWHTNSQTQTVTYKQSNTNCTHGQDRQTKHQTIRQQIRYNQHWHTRRKKRYVQTIYHASAIGGHGCATHMAEYVTQAINTIESAQFWRVFPRGRQFTHVALHHAPEIGCVKARVAPGWRQKWGGQQPAREPGPTTQNTAQNTAVTQFLLSYVLQATQDTPGQQKTPKGATRTMNKQQEEWHVCGKMAPTRRRDRFPASFVFEFQLFGCPDEAL